MCGRFPLSRPRRAASHGTEFGSKLSTEHPRPRSAVVADCTHCADVGVSWFVAVGATTQGGESRATIGIPASVPSPRRRKQVVFVWLRPRFFRQANPRRDPCVSRGAGNAQWFWAIPDAPVSALKKKISRWQTICKFCCQRNAFAAASYLSPQHWPIVRFARARRTCRMPPKAFFTT